MSRLGEFEERDKEREHLRTQMELVRGEAEMLKKSDQNHAGIGTNTERIGNRVVTKETDD